MITGGEHAADRLHGEMMDVCLDILEYLGLDQEEVEIEDDMGEAVMLYDDVYVEQGNYFGSVHIKDHNTGKWVGWFHFDYSIIHDFEMNARGNGMARYNTSPLEISMDDFLEKRLEMDPMLFTKPLFKKYASVDLKRKIAQTRPETGMDFGFFGTLKESLNSNDTYDDLQNKVDDFVWMLNTALDGAIGDYDATFGEAEFLLDEDPMINPGRWEGEITLRDKEGEVITDIDYTYDIEKEWVDGYNHHEDGWFNYEIDNVRFECDDFFKEQIRKNPLFVTTKVFKTHASDKLKAEYPEAGNDFGFFRLSESNNRNRPWPLGSRVRSKYQGDGKVVSIWVSRGGTFLYGVDFDVDINGHSCQWNSCATEVWRHIAGPREHAAREGHGRNMRQDEIELISEPKPEYPMRKRRNENNIFNYGNFVKRLNERKK